MNRIISNRLILIIMKQIEKLRMHTTLHTYKIGIQCSQFINHLLYLKWITTIEYEMLTFPYSLISIGSYIYIIFFLNNKFSADINIIYYKY